MHNLILNLCNNSSWTAPQIQLRRKQKSNVYVILETNQPYYDIHREMLHVHHGKKHFHFTYGIDFRSKCEAAIANSIIHPAQNKESTS
jgi:hypothetical protein